MQSHAIESDELPNCSHAISNFNNYAFGSLKLGILNTTEYYLIIKCNFNNRAAVIKYCADENALICLKRELQFFEMFAHTPMQFRGKDCIIGYYGFGYSPERERFLPELGIMMEFADLGSLDRIITDKCIISLTNMRSIMLDIAKGLEALHQYNVIHCDVKPANVYLLTNEIGVKAKLADFDVSKLESEERDFCGTNAYKAPEVLLEKNQDKKSDIYSMGLTFYSIVARQNLTCEATLNIKKRRQKSVERPPLLSVFPKQLVNIITRCWETNPNERPTATDVVESMTAYIRKRK